MFINNQVTLVDTIVDEQQELSEKLVTGDQIMIGYKRSNH